jgi:hypothetical protein
VADAGNNPCATKITLQNNHANPYATKIADRNRFTTLYVNTYVWNVDDSSTMEIAF